MSDRRTTIGAGAWRMPALPGGRGGRLAAVILAGLLAGAAVLWAVPPGPLRTGLLAAAVALPAAAVLTVLRDFLRRRAGRRILSALSGLTEDDPAAVLVTDGAGRLIARNPAARRRAGMAGADTLTAALRMILADPVPVLGRLRDRVREAGAAREEVTTRAGIVAIAAWRLVGGAVMWRVETRCRCGRAACDGRDAPVPVVVVGRDDEVLCMNRAARDLLGRPVTALGRLFSRLPVRPGEIAAVATAGGRRMVAVAGRGEGTARREYWLVPLDDAARPEAAGAFDTVPAGLARLDRSGRIRALNAPAAELLGDGTGPGDDIGTRLQGADGTAFRDWLAETVAGGRERRTAVFRLSRADGEKHVQVTLGCVRTGRGEEIIAVMHDATEFKSLEAQFVQSQKMQAVGQLAGGIAHDFNNLLTAISGHCDLLLLRHDEADPDYADLIQIHQNANRAAALVGQLLAFSRKQTLRPELLDLRDTLADLTHLLNRLVGEKVTLTLSHDPVLRPIRADKRQLEQVLMNLVVNARDAMPEGGEIRIETEVVTLEAPLHRDRATVPAGDYVVVRVRDEGVGIERDKLQKVFEPFYTTKRTGEGTGLGLSTVYGIVKQTGGFIFVDSAPGRGAEFTLYFPACDRPVPPPPSAPTEAPAQGQAREGEGVVLLVEDEAPVRAFATRALRLRGYTVIEAASGEAALELLRDPDLRVDVFVTDVVMPGMDGPTWVRKALAVRPGARVVFMSGYAEGALGRTGADIGNAAFLPKPFSLDRLVETVRRQMP